MPSSYSLVSGTWLQFALGRDRIMERISVSESVAIISGVSGRYASAIFDLGKESDCLEDFERDMMRLAKTLQESEDFRNLLRSPLYKRSEQENAIVQICDKLGCEKNTRNLFLKLSSLNPLAHPAKGYLQKGISR